MAEYSKLSTMNRPVPGLYTSYGMGVVTVSGSVTDFDVATNSTVFDDVKAAGYVDVSSTGPVEFKVNSISAQELEAHNTFTLDNFYIENLFVTNRGSSADVTITVYGWK